MTDFTLPEEFAERVQKVANRQNRSAAEVLEELFDDKYGEDQTDNEPDDNPLLRIWEMAQEANIPFKEHDLSVRSREILESEYADYLLKRMRGEDVEE